LRRGEEAAAAGIGRFMPHAAAGCECNQAGQQKSGSPHQTNPRRLKKLSPINALYG
jgi:hypothetical protein